MYPSYIVNHLQPLLCFFTIWTATGNLVRVLGKVDYVYTWVFSNLTNKCLLQTFSVKIYCPQNWPRECKFCTADMVGTAIHPVMQVGWLKEESRRAEKRNSVVR